MLDTLVHWHGPSSVRRRLLGDLALTCSGDFVAKNYTAGSIVLAGAGIEHRELVGLAEPLFSNVPDSNKAQHQSKYVGGDFR